MGPRVTQLRFVQLDSELPAPRYAHDGDAGLDLFAREGLVLTPGGGRGTMPTGIAVAIPENCVGLVCPRSGLASSHGVSVLNAPGVIDPGYRGEVAVVLVNHDPTHPFEITRGDRIAQLVITARVVAEPVPVSDLEGTSRGPGGFGHTGR